MYLKGKKECQLEFRFNLLVKSIYSLLVHLTLSFAQIGNTAFQGWLHCSFIEWSHPKSGSVLLVGSSAKNKANLSSPIGPKYVILSVFDGLFYQFNWHFCWRVWFVRVSWRITHLLARLPGKNKRKKSLKEQNECI